MKNICKKTVTIGIPAFNEEANIGNLILDLLNQCQNNFEIEKIIVSSDGSTDRTAEIVKKFKDSRIKFSSNRDRAGVAFRQNEIINAADSDILILLNADILIRDRLFLEKLVEPIIKDGTDLTSSFIKELPAENFIEKVIACSMNMKHFVYGNFNNGLNVYTCHGPARAFSKNLYKKIRFNSSVGEDAYSYLYCIKNNFKYQFVPSAKVLYKLPKTFSDHQKQSVRFFHSQRLLSVEFGNKFIKDNYKLPLALVLKTVIKSFMKQPIYTFVYLLVVINMFITSYFVKVKSNIWDISVSSKSLKLSK